MDLKSLIKKEITILTFSVVLLATGFFVFTYAIYFKIADSEDISISYGNFSIAYCENPGCSGYDASTQHNIIGLTDNTTFQPHTYPLNLDEALALTPYSFVVTNTGNIDAYLEINMSSLWPDEVLGESMIEDFSTFKYGIKLSTSSNYTIGNFDPTGNTQIIANNILISAGEYKIFDFIVWADETSSNDIIEKVIYTKLRVAGYLRTNEHYDIWYDSCTSDSNNLNCKLALNASADTNIDFSMISSSTNGQGVYYTTSTESTEGGKRVYYYRGDVNNNHVLFGGFCWRIVRTTDTGGIKLVYDGVPSNGTCNNTGTATHIETATFNSNYNSLAYVGYMYGEARITKSDDITAKTTNVIFSNNATYNSATDMYELDMNNSYEMIPSNWNSSNTSVNYTQVIKKHYTCLDNRTSCREVYYVNAIYSSDKKVYYQTLSNGETIDDLIDMMLTSSDNRKSSNAKTQIDSWYEENLINYGSYLEDTIFCNDRTITSYGGWNKDNTNYDENMFFGARNRNYSLYKPSLVCPSLNDKFTVNYGRGNGDLTYPVGLLTADEMAMAGGTANTANSSYYLYNGQYQWSLSPYCFDYWSAGEWGMVSSGRLGGYDVSVPLGLRPVVSLKPGTTVSGGNGSSTIPYIIE